MIKSKRLTLTSHFPSQFALQFSAPPDHLILSFKIETLHFIYFYFLLSLFKYSCLHFPATTFPQPHLHPTLILNSTPPLALSMDPLYMFFDNHSLYFTLSPLPLPLQLLPVCSLFQCLWLYFVCFFLLLIMQYGISSKN